MRKLQAVIGSVEYRVEENPNSVHSVSVTLSQQNDNTELSGYGYMEKYIKVLCDTFPPNIIIRTI